MSKFINATAVARAGNLTAGAIVRLPDGRIGTICYNNLEGVGGVWGEHQFEETRALPRPEFLLREKRLEPAFRTDGIHRSDVECVGEMLKIIR